MQEILQAAKIVISLAFLIYASWSDYKTREVTLLVWVVYAPIAVVLSLSELILFDSGRLVLFGVCVGITFVIAFVLTYSGQFGGADSLALVCLALALPFSPSSLFMPLFPSGFSPLSQNIFPITILSNSVLVAAFSAVALLVYNISWRMKTGKHLFENTLANEPAWKKTLVLLTGYRVKIAKVKAKWHIYPLEDITEWNSAEDVKRKIVIVPKDEGRNEVVSRLLEAVSVGKISDSIWASPGLPMLVFVTIGLIIALLFGDIVWILISFVLG